jgi:hypothetical protein
MARSLAFIAVLAACSDGGGKPKDAAGPPDAPPDAGPCPANLLFTGEYVDWDSGTTAEPFCGIMSATFTVHGDATRTDMTAPNGRFRVCLASMVDTRVDITPPTGPSQCTSPMSTYPMPGIVTASAQVMAASQLFSLRNFTVARQPSLGVTLDAAKAHVFAHIDGTLGTVAVAATHDAPQFFDGTMWGATGPAANVFFPNVDASAGSTSATMANSIGGGTLPLEAGKITYVTFVGM